MLYFIHTIITFVLDKIVCESPQNSNAWCWNHAAKIKVQAVQIHFSIIVYFMFWIVKLGWGNKTGGQSYISCYSRRLTGLQTRRIWGEECTESFIEAGWCCLCLPINCHYTVQWQVGSGQRGGHGFRFGLIGRMLGISGVRCTAHRHYLQSALLRTKYLCVEWQQMTNTNKF